MDTTNPLARYCRAATVHQALPTSGQFFEEGEIDLALNGEVAILPMTASDEIILKNPDALLNGEALERLFKSCVPAIKNPRHISVPDMDVLLLAIKLASYGDNLEVNVTCPECENEFSTETSIRGLLSAIAPVKDEDTVLRVNDTMVINLKPYDFESKTILDIKTFQETKALQYLTDTELTEDERQSKFNSAFERMAELNLDLLSHCVKSITIPENKVTDQQFISEFIQNTDRATIQKITDKLKSLSESGIPKTLEVECPKEECKHKWTAGMIFDASRFFA